MSAVFVVIVFRRQEGQPVAGRERRSEAWTGRAWRTRGPSPCPDAIGRSGARHSGPARANRAAGISSRDGRGPFRPGVLGAVLVGRRPQLETLRHRSGRPGRGRRSVAAQDSGWPWGDRLPDLRRAQPHGERVAGRDAGIVRPVCRLRQLRRHAGRSVFGGPAAIFRPTTGPTRDHLTFQRRVIDPRPTLSGGARGNSPSRQPVVRGAVHAVSVRRSTMGRAQLIFQSLAAQLKPFLQS